MTDLPPEQDDEEDVVDPDDYPGLSAVNRFAHMVESIPWFSRLGEEFEEDELDWAQAYLEAMGFPGAAIVAVLDWEEAEATAGNTDWNTAWWEAEEQLRMALITEACARAPEEDVMAALTHVTSQASETIFAAAEMAASLAGIDDEELIRAAAGAATQATYQAALVLAAEAAEDEDDHPFALKYRLYEAGRWPLSLIGGSFNLF